VPPLRERSEDIPLLVQHFVEQYAKRMGKRITTVSLEAMEVLSRHSWPGNVRELQNVVERAVILSTGKVLRPFLDELQPSFQTDETLGPEKKGHQTTLKDLEREHILHVLGESATLGQAAATLGIAVTTLWRKRKQYRIE